MSYVYDEIFGWGEFDITFLDDKIAELQKIGGDPDKARDRVQDEKDINSWLYAVMTEINEIIIEEAITILEEEEESNNLFNIEPLVNRLLDMQKNFNPFCNYLNTRYNNLIDDIEITYLSNTAEDLIDRIKNGWEANNG